MSKERENLQFHYRKQKFKVLIYLVMNVLIKKYCIYRKYVQFYLVVCYDFPFI